MFFLHTVQAIGAPADDFCDLPPWGASALRLPAMAAAKLTCSDSFAPTYSTAASPVQASSSAVFVRSCTYCNSGVRMPSSVSPEVEGQPWVPDGSTVGPRFLGGNRGFPHKNRQPWVPATSFLFCVRWATRPNCQPLTLSHLESDGGPTASMPSAARPHCILPARNLETLTIF